MGIREEIEKLKPYKLLIYLQDGHDMKQFVVRDAVLSILDEHLGECVEEGEIWEPDVGGCLYLKTETLLSPVQKVVEDNFKPGDHISIYVRRKKNESSS